MVWFPTHKKSCKNRVKEMSRTLLRTFALLAFTVVGLSANAQDLLARQAPVNRRIKSIDSLALVKQIKAEQAAYPAYTLYNDWNTSFVHAYGKDVAIPDTFRIDLRGFHMPTTHTLITSKCGPRWRRMHNGIDVKVYIGDTIRSAFDGRVRIVKYEARGYGKYVVIRHDNGLETIYGHLSSQLVREGEYIKAGKPIGLGGNTGRSTGSHLHFETRVLGQVINPEFLFDFPNQDIVADSYLFIRGANMYEYQRNRALAALKRGESTESVVASSEKATAAKNAASLRYYKVRKGDTLAKVARKHRISVSKLCKLNGISAKKSLRPGQVLRCA